VSNRRRLTQKRQRERSPQSEARTAGSSDSLSQGDELLERAVHSDKAKAAIPQGRTQRLSKKRLIALLGITVGIIAVLADATQSIDIVKGWITPPS
jgi:hypothetical protein